MINAPERPAALQGLEEKAQGLVKEFSSWCTFHGKQEGVNCPECDKHYPEAVAARQIGAAAPGVIGYTQAEVDAMVQKAVRQAMQEQAAFNAWKASPEGQAAAKEAPTFGKTPPDHSNTPDVPPAPPVA